MSQERKSKGSLLRERGGGAWLFGDKTTIKVLYHKEENIAGFQLVPLMAAKPVRAYMAMYLFIVWS